MKNTYRRSSRKIEPSVTVKQISKKSNLIHNIVHGVCVASVAALVFMGYRIDNRTKSMQQVELTQMVSKLNKANDKIDILTKQNTAYANEIRQLSKLLKQSLGKSDELIYIGDDQASKDYVLNLVTDFIIKNEGCTRVIYGSRTKQNPKGTLNKDPDICESYRDNDGIVRNGFGTRSLGPDITQGISKSVAKQRLRKYVEVQILPKLYGRTIQSEGALIAVIDTMYNTGASADSLFVNNQVSCEKIGIYTKDKSVRGRRMSAHAKCIQY